MEIKIRYQSESQFNHAAAKWIVHFSSPDHLSNPTAEPAGGDDAAAADVGGPDSLAREPGGEAGLPSNGNGNWGGAAAAFGPQDAADPAAGEVRRERAHTLYSVCH